MDMNLQGVKDDESRKSLNSLESAKVVLTGELDGDDDSQSLLPSKRGGLSEKSEKPRRKVQWLDRNGGAKLAQILEFQPSDASDTDDDDSDSCICRIM